MSAVGKRIWLHMQDREPAYNRKSLAKVLSTTGTYPTSSQSITNYLRRPHPPANFVVAVVDLLGLTEADELELRELYFRGPRRPSRSNLNAADEIEEEEDEGEDNNSQGKRT